MSKRLNNCIYDKRLSKDITQESLAESIGVTRQTIIAIEKGNYTPSVALALKLSAFFKTSVEELFWYD
ncbi:helix-turn-helix transcriptional regulator [Candidatus Nomurabacteria bacterium]|nr:helix-turn-helix transcriptional regulator [Candidatus Nomurabacteria bacterium]